jgi:hypothetical protein
VAPPRQYIQLSLPDGCLLHKIPVGIRKALPNDPVTFHSEVEAIQERQVVRGDHGCHGQLHGSLLLFNNIPVGKIPSGRIRTELREYDRQIRFTLYRSENQSQMP